MAEALATLPWVEADSIKASRETRQARFTVKDPGQFNLDQVRSAISKAGYPSTKLLTGPTEK